MKPPNLLMGVGAALAYLVARRWRSAVVFGVAVAPSLFVLALWKYRGLGYLPGLTLGEARLAAAASVGAVDVSLDKYFEFDWEHWKQQMDYLREFFWSARLVQWAPFAGLLAVLRMRRGAIAALLAGWLGAFLLIKGFSTRADIQANTFWRLLMPAWPAYLLLLSAIPLLVPTAARRLGARVRPRPAGEVGRRTVVVVAALLVIVPAIAIAASVPVQGGSSAVLQDDGVNTIFTPVDGEIETRAVRSPSGSVRLSWSGEGRWRAGVFYRVFRHDGDESDVECEHPSDSRVAYCFLRATVVGTTRKTVFVDPSAPTRATYRIGIGTNWIDDPEAGDVFVFSPPAAAAD